MSLELSGNVLNASKLFSVDFSHLSKLSTSSWWLSWSARTKLSFLFRMEISSSIFSTFPVVLVIRSLTSFGVACLRPLVIRKSISQTCYQKCEINYYKHWKFTLGNYSSIQTKAWFPYTRYNHLDLCERLKWLTMGSLVDHCVALRCVALRSPVDCWNRATFYPSKTLIFAVARIVHKCFRKIAGVVHSYLNDYMETRLNTW